MLLLTVVHPEDRLTRRDVDSRGSKADVLHRHRHVRFLGERSTNGNEQTDDGERGPQDAQAQPVGTRHVWHSTVFPSPTAKATAPLQFALCGARAPFHGPVSATRN